MEGKKEVALTAGFSLVPATFEEAQQFAKIMADSDMVPVAYKGKPGNVLVAVQMGAELGIKPLQALQNIACINGKPSIYGDLGVAILRSHGCQIDSDDIDVVKKNKRARCKITRTSGETVERTFGEDDARAAGLWGKQGPWTTYPWRQMAWRAFWFAARDAAADLLKGMHGAEEMQDIIEVERVDTVVDDGPKRASETVAAPAAPPTIAQETVTSTTEAPKPEEFKITGIVDDITYKGLGGGVFDFTVNMKDDEGPIQLNTKDSPLAKTLKAAKDAKTMVTVVYTAGKGRNDILRTE